MVKLWKLAVKIGYGCDSLTVQGIWESPLVPWSPVQVLSQCLQARNENSITTRSDGIESCVSRPSRHRPGPASKLFPGIMCIPKSRDAVIRPPVGLH